MPNAAAPTIEGRTVEASVNYLVDTGVKPVNETGGGDVGVIRHTGQHDPRTVTISRRASAPRQLSSGRGWLRTG